MKECILIFDNIPTSGNSLIHVNKYMHAQIKATVLAPK